MLTALQIILLGQALYWSPLLFGRRCLGVGLFLFPAGWVVSAWGIIDLLGAVS